MEPAVAAADLGPEARETAVEVFEQGADGGALAADALGAGDVLERRSDTNVYRHRRSLPLRMGGRADGCGAAERIVIDQLGDRRVVAADGTVGVAADLERAHLHRERVDDEQAAVERLADVPDELERLG